MLLGLLALGIIAFALFVFLRDKRFMQRTTKEVAKERADDEMREYLNLPNENSHFDVELDDNIHNRRPSRSLLDEFNSND